MSNTISNCKVPVVLRDDYIMYLELYDDLLWFHTDVRSKWTPLVKKRYVEDLNKLQDLVGFPLMALITEDNHKLAKFAKTVNWEVKGQIMLNNSSKGFIYAPKRTAGE